MNIIKIILSLPAIMVYLFAGLILGIVFFQRLPKWDIWERLIAAMIPLSLITAGGIILNAVLSMPFWSFNSHRLTPTFSLAYGYPLYQPMDEGPILASIYSPVSALAYFPAAWLKTPTGGLIVAGILSTSFFFLPILWLHVAGKWHDFKQLVLSLGAFSCFVLFTVNSEALNYSAFSIHADAPALGLSAIACAALYRRQRQTSIAPLLISAIFAVLAILTKQLTLPLPIALLIYLWLANGFKAFRRYLICLIVVGLGISIPLLAGFNPQLMYLNIITLPSRQPWALELTGQSNKAVILASATKNFPILFFLPLIGVLSYLLWQLSIVSKRSGKVRFWIQSNPWLMLLLVAIMMSPTATLGRVKIGGDVNNYSFSGYFLTAAFTLILLESALNLLPLEDNSVSLSARSKLSTLLIFSLIVSFIWGYVISLQWIPKSLSRLPSNAEQVAYEYALKHPNQVYFPWYSLAGLMADQQLYHHPMGMLDRAWGDFEIKDEHFRKHIPEETKLIAFYQQNPKNSTMKYLPGYNQRFIHPLAESLESVILKYLPEFSQPVTIDELPGWIIYQKP